MRIILATTHALALVALTGTAMAGAGNHGHCPPGLAKKTPACVPPGLAKTQPYYRIGDRIDDDYVVILNPDRYGLDPRGTYYHVGDHVFRVDRETREVLDLIGAAAAVLD